MSSRDCKRQTTNVYNSSKPYISRYTNQFSNRMQNHYSTEVLKTVNTGMYWYTLITCHTWLYIWFTLRVSYELQKPVILREYLSFWWGPCWSSFWFFVLSYYVFLRYDFRIKSMFGSSLHPVVSSSAHVLFTLLVCVFL